MQTTSRVCHCEEQSDEAISSKDEIAAPFGLAMTVTVIFVCVSIIRSIRYHSRNSFRIDKTYMNIWVVR